MYQPVDGDRVVVTRVARDGRTTVWTGRVSEVLLPEDARDEFGGFRLTGVTASGDPVDTYLSAWRGFDPWCGTGITQTITCVRAAA